MLTRKQNGVARTAVVALLAGVLIATVIGVLWSRRFTPIPIGFVGSLTGAYAHWGVAARDGLLLYVDKTNAAGGIEGHKLEVIIRDDGADADRAAATVEEFANMGIVVIAGPTLSTSALKAVPVANRRKVLLIASTVSTGELLHLDDNFIRVCVSEDEPARVFAEYLFNRRGWRQVTSVISAANQSYHENVLKLFRKYFEPMGGRVTSVDLLTPSSDLDEIGDLLSKRKVDGIYIVAPPIETAALCQKIRSRGSSAPFAIIGSPTDQELSQFGGASMEGATTFLNAAAVVSEAPSWKDFSRIYRERYGAEPHQGAGFGYDAGVVIGKALAQSKELSAENLKATILQIGDFPGVRAPFHIDQYGDTSRGDTFIGVLRQGKYQVLPAQ